MRRFFFERGRTILDYLYPLRCPVCDRISPEGICASCKKQVKYIGDSFCLKCGKPLEDECVDLCGDCRRKHHAFEQGRALFSYEGGIRYSLYRMKYGNKREYAISYGREMADHLSGWIRRCGITLIIPVPLHRKRLRERGYNQASLLARELGRQLRIPVEEKLLFRKKETVAQKILAGQQRKNNVRDAFAVQGTTHHGHRILLVDDIYTTGNTVDAASVCLKCSGECKVFVLTAAIGG